jgi:hypothetical protein
MIKKLMVVFLVKIILKTHNHFSTQTINKNLIVSLVQITMISKQEIIYHLDSNSHFFKTTKIKEIVNPFLATVKINKISRMVFLAQIRIIFKKIHFSIIKPKIRIVFIQTKIKIKVIFNLKGIRIFLEINNPKTHTSINKIRDNILINQIPNKISKINLLCFYLILKLKVYKIRI